MVADNWPDTRTECFQRKLAARPVLLITNVPVRHQRSRFASPQEFTIVQLRPPVPLDDSPDFMPREEAPHSDRKGLIEQDGQRGGS